MKDSGAKQLCTVRSDLSGVRDSELEAVKQKRRHQGLFSRSARWYNCTYEVRAVVGAADLTFELWFNGQRFSKNHAPIRVTWDDEGTAAPGAQGGQGEGTVDQEGGGRVAPDPTAQGGGAAVADTGSVSGSSPVGSVSGVSGRPSDLVSHSR
ncbi:hypothetical protein SLS64_008462 [Diaporthe eres]|uniref:Uncharacterized protein n=1 Tax=Diaporthe eres TaxID=83184 RepID=A0ABR1PKV0_DIAER